MLGVKILMNATNEDAKHYCFAQHLHAPAIELVEARVYFHDSDIYGAGTTKEKKAK